MSHHLRAVIDRVFAFDQVQAAMAFAAAGNAKGKIVIDVAGQEAAVAGN